MAQQTIAGSFIASRSTPNRSTANSLIAAMEPALTNRLRELRTARAWTQEHLAAAVGVSRQSINSIERGRYIPSLPLALQLARLFECPVDQIFSLEKPCP